MRTSINTQPERTTSRNVGQRGFGLIELVMVVAIIGILAAVAIPEYGAMMQRAREVEGTLIIKSLERQQMAFLAFYDRYGTLEELGGWGSVTTASASGSTGPADGDSSSEGPADGGFSHFGKIITGGGVHGSGGGGGGRDGDGTVVVVLTPTPPPAPTGTPAPSATPTPTPPPPTAQADGCNAYRLMLVLNTNVANTFGSANAPAPLETVVTGTNNFCLYQQALTADHKIVIAFAVLKPPDSYFYSPTTLFHALGLFAGLPMNNGLAFSETANLTVLNTGAF